MFKLPIGNYQYLHAICCMDKSLHLLTDSIRIYNVPVDKKRLSQPNIVPVSLCLHHCFILKQCPFGQVRQVNNTVLTFIQ